MGGKWGFGDKKQIDFDIEIIDTNNEHNKICLKLFGFGRILLYSDKNLKKQQIL